MAAYAFREYTWEERLYPDTYAQPLTQAQAKRVLRRMAKHFKVYLRVKVLFNLRTRNSGKYLGFGVIALHPTSITLGLVAHEFAHLLISDKLLRGLARKQPRSHGEHFQRAVCQVQYYARSEILPRLKKTQVA